MDHRKKNKKKKPKLWRLMVAGAEGKPTVWLNLKWSKRVKKKMNLTNEMSDANWESASCTNDLNRNWGVIMRAPLSVARDLTNQPVKIRRERKLKPHICTNDEVVVECGWANGSLYFFFFLFDRRDDEFPPLDIVFFFRRRCRCWMRAPIIFCQYMYTYVLLNIYVHK